MAARLNRPREGKPLDPRRIAAGVAMVVLAAVVYGVLWRAGAIATIMDSEGLHDWVARLGIVGPLAIVGLIALAIVFSPLPSAPIALAAGAAYGHIWGTVYVALGAEIGALAAFAIARLVGYEVLRKWFGDRLSLGPLGSQNTLMGIVFVSRLLPFISFDLVSYAAGLTPLKAWRFAVATLAGIIPASFLLAHFGGEFASADARRITLAVLALGLVTGVPVAIKVFLDRRAKRNEQRKPKPR